MTASSGRKQHRFCSFEMSKEIWKNAGKIAVTFSLHKLKYSLISTCLRDGTHARKAICGMSKNEKKMWRKVDIKMLDFIFTFSDTGKNVLRRIPKLKIGRASVFAFPVFPEPFCASSVSPDLYPGNQSDHRGIDRIDRGRFNRHGLPGQRRPAGRHTVPHPGRSPLRERMRPRMPFKLRT